MKIKIFLLFIIYSITTYSQCFDCGHSIGGHTEDYVVDIDKATDGIILTTNPNQGWGRSIYKYDFNCNLVWTNRLEPDNSISSDGISFSDTTLDSNNNIYSIITNHRGGEIIEGFTIEQGNSLIKLNSTGSIVWVKKISDQYYLKRKVHFWNDNIYVVGQLDEGINTNIGLTVSSDMGESQYFIAQFDILGNLIKSQLYGTNSYDYFFDSQIDDDGNIYFTGQMQSSSVSYYYTTGIPYFFKINSNLNLIWSKNISNYLNLKFTPLTIYYNNTNNNLYLWNKYYKSTPDSNGCNVGSVVMEISKNTGNIENQITIDNCGYMQPVGNGTANVEQKSFITHEGSNLYILSSFRKEITIGNQTVNSTKTIHDQYNSDLILYKIDLTNFSPELILKSNGEQYYSSSPYYDLAGPIVAFNESVYITSSFTSSPITINGNTIINNSGNNGRDILYYKYNLNQDSPNNLISFKNTCLSETTEFSINGDFDSVLWNFDNPASGLDNTSTLTNPKHTFTNSGIYNVSVLVTCGIESETLNIEVVVTDSPNVNQISDIYACEDVYGSQISSSFDSSSIENDLIGNQSNLTIKYFNENGIELPSPLPNPFSNSILGKKLLQLE
ncbi:PKD domain-containing protein [Tenacibaculum mesophilum]|uniref:PKD domain-containing protein n=1 Tax=Tenacibaculum mesophilum TaxID=104268 RepID=UPI00069E4C3B|nr:PKD domain-containing protein [Tenacibaculum mesophilum]